MTEMKSLLEDYADELGFYFDGYFIYRRVGDALRVVDSLYYWAHLHHPPITNKKNISKTFA